MNRLLIAEGADASGKSTFIKNLLESDSIYELIKTPRQVGYRACDGCWEFYDMIMSLPNDKIYVLDRHTHSNYAYNGMRSTDYSPIKDLELLLAFQSSFDIFHAILIRKPRHIEDDLISLSKKQDATVIQRYLYLANLLSVRAYDIVSSEKDRLELLNNINKWRSTAVK